MSAGALDKNILKKKLILGSSGTSTERFSKSEQNWIQAWGCAILKEMGKQMNESFYFILLGRGGLLFVYILKEGVAPSVMDIIITVFL